MMASHQPSTWSFLPCPKYRGSADAPRNSQRHTCRRRLTHWFTEVGDEVSSRIVEVFGRTRARSPWLGSSSKPRPGAAPPSFWGCQRNRVSARDPDRAIIWPPRKAADRSILAPIAFNEDRIQSHHGRQSQNQRRRSDSSNSRLVPTRRAAARAPHETGCASDANATYRGSDLLARAHPIQRHHSPENPDFKNRQGG